MGDLIHLDLGDIFGVFSRRGAVNLETGGLEEESRAQSGIGCRFADSGQCCKENRAEGLFGGAHEERVQRMFYVSYLGHKRFCTGNPLRM